jgi:hypothetical protein
MKQKRTKRLELRLEPELLKNFQTACDSLGYSHASVIRDLIASACTYITETCKGRWFPPRLVPDMPETTPTATIVQVHNGNGHQKALIKKRQR